MDDLQEQLSCSWVEDEDGSVYRFCCQVALESLVDGHTIDVCVIDEPDHLVCEEVGVVLGVEVGLCRF